MNLTNKAYVISGATSGIGRAAAEILASRGSTVIGVGRSLKRCQETESFLRSTYSGIPITYLRADLSLQSDVLSLANEIRHTLDGWEKPGLDGLINNAGTFTFRFSSTAEGFETQWAVNHLAPFLLTHKLMPCLEAAPQARIITVSSGSHYRGRINWADIQLRRNYQGLRAYQQTKLANVLFSTELNRRLGAKSSVHAFAADPGLVQTDIGLKGNPGLVGWFWKLRRASGISADESAQGIITLLEQDGIQNSTEVYWKHGIPKTPSPLAQDEEAARRLWVISEEMCGIAKQ